MCCCSNYNARSSESSLYIIIFGHESQFIYEMKCFTFNDKLFAKYNKISAIFCNKIRMKFIFL